MSDDRSELYEGDFVRRGTRLVFRGKSWRFELTPQMRQISDQIHCIRGSIVDSPKKAEKDLQDIISQYPFALGAYDCLHDTLYYSHRYRKALRAVEKGFSRAKELFPKEFVFGSSPLPWSVPENRGFLMICYCLGSILLWSGRKAEAEAMLERLFGMDPNGNIALMETLCECYLDQGHYDSLLRLGKVYPEDSWLELNLNSILALIKTGRLEEAKSILGRWAPEDMVYLSKIMARGGAVKGGRPEPLGEGDESDASMYWEQFGRFWDKDAIKFIQTEAMRIR